MIRHDIGYNQTILEGDCRECLQSLPDERYVEISKRRIPGTNGQRQQDAAGQLKMFASSA